MGVVKVQNITCIRKREAVIKKSKEIFASSCTWSNATTRSKTEHVSLLRSYLCQEFQRNSWTWFFVKNNDTK